MATVNPIQVQKYLSGMSYPASKQDIVEKARQEGADETTLAALEKMPDESFETPADVSQALGQVG
jgi:hypothetical protein